jgi:hypothetical protein
VYGEALTGTGTSFTLAHTPVTGSLRVYRGGARLKLTEDYTITGANLTMLIPVVTGEILLADYNY